MKGQPDAFGAAGEIRTHLGASALAATARTALVEMQPGETFWQAFQRVLADPDQVQSLLQQALVAHYPGITPDAAARIIARSGWRRVALVFCENIARVLEEEERTEALLSLASMMPVGRPS